jgi:hypothetical protein
LNYFVIVKHDSLLQDFAFVQVILYPWINDSTLFFFKTKLKWVFWLWKVLKRFHFLWDIFCAVWSNTKLRDRSSETMPFYRHWPHVLCYLDRLTILLLISVRISWDFTKMFSRTWRWYYKILETFSFLERIWALILAKSL